MSNKFIDFAVRQYVAKRIPRSKTHTVLFTAEKAAVKGIQKTYDYVICAKALEKTSNIQSFLENLHSLCDEHGRLVIFYRNYVYGFIRDFLTKTHSPSNWISSQD